MIACQYLMPADQLVLAFALGVAATIAAFYFKGGDPPAGDTK